MGTDSRALTWIVELLSRLDVRFQAVGGLAARSYGARRPLADLDFCVPEARLEEIARAAAPYVVRPSAHCRDEFWDRVFMKIEYEGQQIELAGAEGAHFFDRIGGWWRRAEIDFNGSVECRVLDVAIPVMPAAQLIAYKNALARDVDRQDVAAVLAAQGRYGTK